MPAELYYNGDILTMENEVYTEAVLVENGVIAAAGPKEALLRTCPQAKLCDLKGCTMLPAFIDPHSHISALSSTMGLVSLSGAKSIDEISQRLREFERKNPLKDGEWVIGFGYDHNDLKERRHPTRFDLDKAISNHPVLISHASGHMGAANTLALKEGGVTRDCENPQGGVIGRGEDGEPDGYLEETAFVGFSKHMPASGAPTLDSMDKAQKVYLQNGITTVQDGLTREADWALLKAMAQAGRFLVDVVSYPDLKNSKNLMRENPEYQGNYLGRLRIGGYKLILDGSPQGKTAWLSAPYENEPDGYRGYPVYSDEEALELMKIPLKEQKQLLCHCNGDAASEQFIDCYEAAMRETGETKDLRPVMIHAQTVRLSQLDRMKPIHMIPSFFVAHVYYWGDVHLINLGERRASRISPVKSAARRRIPFTLHQDTPVIAPNMLETIWCAVNRVTKRGVALGKEERADPLTALKGVTIHAAHQYFEEDTKGSIKAGKLADLVILDKNPLKVEPMEIRDIRVLSTIKDGECVYRRE